MIFDETYIIHEKIKDVIYSILCFIYIYSKYEIFIHCILYSIYCILNLIYNI